MSKTVDARGLACPQPVILTRQALQAGEPVTTIVDDDTAQHNVTRMAERAGCTVQSERRDDGIYLHIARREGGAVTATADEPAFEACAPAAGPLVLLVASDTLGRGDPELGSILVRSFFHTLGEVSPSPEMVIFINAGVKLAAQGSPVVDDLRALAERGIAILACGTCLGFYGLKEQLAIGEITNMYTIAETLLRASKVLSL